MNTHICYEFVDVAIYALYPESFFIKIMLPGKFFLTLLNWKSTFCLSPVCTVHFALNSVHCEWVELSEQFMSGCPGLDVSPTLLRLPNPICYSRLPHILYNLL